jgi:hypothetical protein
MFLLVKSRIKYIQRREQGDCLRKMAGTRFYSFVANLALIPGVGTTRITPWQTALKFTVDCHNKYNPLAICSLI